MAKKRCVCCGESFEPSPRAWRVDEGVRRCFQKVCSKKRCRKHRQGKARAQWLAGHPAAYKGRYSETKGWLADHPGYLQGYRKRNPEYVAKDNRRRREDKIKQRRRADIQDAIPRREIRRIRGVEGADIQDTIRRRLDGLLCVLGGSSGPICKTLSPAREAPG